MKIRVLVVLVCALALAGVSFAASPVTAGKWQVTMNMDMPGMPMKMPPIVTTSCITPEQAANPQSAVPTGSNKKNSDCKISNMKIDGSTVTYDVKCEKENMTGNGEFTYAADSYTGKMVMNIGEQTMTMKFAGKHLGDCDK